MARLAINRFSPLVLGLLLIAVLCFAAPPAGQKPEVEMIQYLNRTIDWYHRVEGIGAMTGSSQDVMFRDSLRQQARNAVGLGFRFARARASLFDNDAAARPTSGPTDARTKRLTQALNNAQARVNELRNRLNAIDAEIRGGAGTTRPTLASIRAKVAAEMDLANARQEAIKQFSEFAEQTAGGTQAGIAQQVEDLARSVPDAADADLAAATQPVSAHAGGGEPFRPESAGIVRLISELFTLSSQVSDVNSLAVQTDELLKANSALGAPMKSELQAASQRGDVLAASRPATNESALNSQQNELNDLATRFRDLAGAALPLGEQRILLDRTHATLMDWKAALHRETTAIVRHLLIRLGFIVGFIILVLFISAIWRRATFKYVSDTRRQRQFLLLRRIVVGVMITLIIVGGFVAEFGSLATFAGLITAGIAVSLQTVILSAVAYFFYIGRYGVRVGDRVTVGGVTGDVVDIGLFRLYLMELGGNHLKQKPTGRVAVFSNSVLFAATGFFRQVPGADYAWHEVALTLAPTSDYKLAEKRLMDAVLSVHQKYRDDLQRQHAAASRSFHVPVPSPTPEGRLRFVDAGLEFVVRYPVELGRAAETDDSVTRALLDAIEAEPKLKLVAAGTPSVQSAG
jgi:small-conductance mechanosensitive channel